MKERIETTLTMRTAFDHQQLRRLSHPNSLCKDADSQMHPPVQPLDPPLDRPTLPPIATKLVKQESQQSAIRYGGGPNFIHPFDSSQGPIALGPPVKSEPQSRRSSTTSTRQTSESSLRLQHSKSKVSKSTRDRHTNAAVFNTCKVPLSPQEAFKAVAKAERADKKNLREQYSRLSLSMAIARLNQAHSRLGIIKHTQLNTQNSKNFEKHHPGLRSKYTKEETLVGTKYILDEFVELVPREILAIVTERVNRKLEKLRDQKQTASQNTDPNIRREVSYSPSSRSSPFSDSGFGSE